MSQKFPGIEFPVNPVRWPVGNICAAVRPSPKGGYWQWRYPSVTEV